MFYSFCVETVYLYFALDLSSIIKKIIFFTFPLSNLVSISLSFQNELSKFPSADNIFSYKEFSEICFVILSFKITYFHIRFVYDLFQTFGSLSHAVH